MRDIVAYYNGLSKGDYWSMEAGDHQNMLEEAVEEIERLRTLVGEHHTRFCSATAKHCPLCAAVQPSDGAR